MKILFSGSLFLSYAPKLSLEWRLRSPNNLSGSRELRGSLMKQWSRQSRAASPAATAGLVVLAFVLAGGCENGKSDPAAEAPPPAQVESQSDPSIFQVNRPERFPLVTATEHQATSILNVTGTVSPDVSREIPVVSIASGRVMALHVRLGDYVKKGQLIMEVQSTDISGAYQTYLKAV